MPTPYRGLKATYRADLLGGVRVLEGSAFAADGKATHFTAIPFFATANRGGLAPPRRLNRLDSDCTAREQPTEQHPVIAKPKTDRLEPVPGLQRLASIPGHIMR